MRLTGEPGVPIVRLKTIPDTARTASMSANHHLCFMGSRRVCA